MTHHRDGARRPWTLIGTGLALQLCGAAAQGLWHTVGTDGVLTQARTFWIDHTISNAGVACLAAGAVLLNRRRGGAAARVVLAGAAIEAAGALADAYAHLNGGENPFAFALIATGYLLAAGGGAAAWRARRRAAVTPGP